MAIGKPHGATTYMALANFCIKSVFDMGKSFDRIGVTFDRYLFIYLLKYFSRVPIQHSVGLPWGPWA